MQQYVQRYIAMLQKENYKSFYLAFFRVAIGCWLLKEVAINWSSFDLLYGQSAFVEGKNSEINTFITRLFKLAKGHHSLFMGIYVLAILSNMFGIGRRISGVLLFTMVYFLQKLNVANINGGDIMARLLLFYLIFAESYEYFVLVSKKREADDLQKLRNLVSNLAALSIMVQLCVAYFSAGISKLTDPAWLHGEATYYVMSIERFMGTPFNKYIVQHKWADYFFNYATILFELVFPILIWRKMFRKPLLAAGILFHAFIYIFLMIYGFEVLFVLTYGLFLPNQQCIDITQKLTSFFKRKAISGYGNSHISVP